MLKIWLLLGTLFLANLATYSSVQGFGAGGGGMSLPMLLAMLRMGGGGGEALQMMIPMLLMGGMGGMSGAAGGGMPFNPLLMGGMSMMA